VFGNRLAGGRARSGERGVLMRFSCRKPRLPPSTVRRSVSDHNDAAEGCAASPPGRQIGYLDAACPRGGQSLVLPNGSGLQQALRGASSLDALGADEA